MNSEIIQIYRAVYNKFDHVDGRVPADDDDRLVGLIRKGDNVLDGETGFFFETIDGYFIIAFEKKKGFRDEEFFELYFINPGHVASAGLTNVIAWLDQRGMASQGYQAVIDSDTDQFEWEFTVNKSQLQTSSKPTTEQDPGKNTDTDPRVETNANEQPEVDAETTQTNEGGWSDKFEEDISGSTATEGSPTDSDTTTVHNESSSEKRGSTESIEDSHPETSYDRRTSSKTDYDHDDDGVTKESDTTRTTRDESSFSEQQEESNGKQRGETDNWPDFGDRTSDGDQDRSKEDRAGEHSERRDEGVEILGDDESGEKTNSSRTDDSDSSIFDNDEETSRKNTNQYRADYDDGKIIDASDEDNDEDDNRTDGGVPEELELVADLYDRYRRDETGESGAIPATLEELTTFVQTVDGALAEISYVSDPRSNASAFDFAHGERDSSASYEALTQYLHSRYTEGQLDWESLPSYEDEIKHDIDQKKKELTPEPSYDQVFSNAEQRMKNLLEAEFKTARSHMHKAVAGELSAPADDSGWRGSMSNLNPFGGDDDPTPGEQNINEVYSDISDYDVELDDDQVEALAQHIAGKAAEEMAEKIEEQVCSQLETELREATNDELVELAFDSIAKSDKIVRSESYRRYKENNGR